MTLLSQNWVSIAVGILLSSSVFCVLGLLASWALKNNAPVARVLVLRASITGVAVSTLFCIGSVGRVQPLWNWPASIPSITQNQNALLTDSTSLKITPVKSDEKFSAQKSATPVNAENAIPTSAPTIASQNEVKKIAAVLWLLGVLPALAWMVTCHLSLARLRRRALDIRSTPAAAEMRHLTQSLHIRASRLLCSETVQGPLLCGLWRPAIVLPSDYRTQFNAPALRAVLLHELIHLKHRDLYWSATSRLLCALLWPQILLHFVARHLEAASEEVCDAAVIEHGCEPRDYARCLLELAERFSPRAAERVAGAGVLPLRSSLSKRVQNILDESRRHSSRLSRRARVFAALFVCISAASPFIIGAANAESEKPDLSSPEATVRSFVAAINAKDFEMAASCVQDALPSKDLQSLKERLNLVDFQFSIKQLKTTKSPTTATVNLQTLVRAKLLTGQKQEEDGQSQLNLTRHLNEWKIGLDESESATPRDSLRLFIFMLAPPRLEQLKLWIAENSPATVTGRVLNEDGTPAANTTIGIHIEQKQLEKLRGAPKNVFDIGPWQSALPSSLSRFLNCGVTTDANGNYTITDLAATTYNIAPRIYQRLKEFPQTQNFPEKVATAPQRVQARRNKTVQAPDIILTRGAIINVRVVDQTSHKPLPNVSIVGSIGKDRTPGGVVQTDASGLSRFRFPLGKVNIAIGGTTAPTTHSFVAQVNNNFYSLQRDIKVFVDGKKIAGSSSIDIEVQKGQTRNIVFRLKRYIPPKQKTSM